MEFQCREGKNKKYKNLVYLIGTGTCGYVENNEI